MGDNAIKRLMDEEFKLRFALARKSKIEFGGMKSV
jgi:hypothetical protein